MWNKVAMQKICEKSLGVVLKATLIFYKDISERQSQHLVNTILFRSMNTFFFSKQSLNLTNILFSKQNKRVLSAKTTATLLDEKKEKQLQFCHKVVFEIG